MKECACGCGTLIQEKDKKGRSKSFLVGHNNRKKRSVVKCSCGCGAKFENVNKWGRDKAYLRGHDKKTDLRDISDVIKTGYSISESGCWEWNGRINENGYGRIALNGKQVYAHRASYEVFNNYKLKDEDCVLHKCDNPLCMNPDHLFVGTYTDNTHDAIKKDRLIAKVIITDSDIALIRSMASFNMYSQRWISKLFKIGEAHVSRIVNNVGRKTVVQPDHTMFGITQG